MWELSKEEDFIIFLSKLAIKYTYTYFRTINYPRLTETSWTSWEDQEEDSFEILGLSSHPQMLITL